MLVGRKAPLEKNSIDILLKGSNRKALLFIPSQENQGL
jgi:hypothetical protein